MAEEDKKVTEVATATAVATVSPDDEKLGAKCCACCCDYRRAVIVLAIMGIVFSVIYLVLVLVGVGILASAATSAVDDDFVNTTATVGAIGAGVVAGIFAVAALFYVFMLFAALKYNVCMLATVVVFDCIFFVYNIYVYIAFSETTSDMVGGIIGTCIFTGLWMYPTVGLITEIKKGIMSPETYPREAYSCCCEPQV